MEIDLPLITLRPYQQQIWNAWFSKRGKNKRLSLEWARRHGKDLLSLNIMIAESMVVIGNYWHILPQQQQVRVAIWDGITSEGEKYLDFIPDELIHKKDNQSFKIYMKNPIEPEKAGSIISFVGGDSYEKKLGAGLQGAVISEHSLQKPNLYDLGVEPMLKETKGWCIFNFTPRGENHATQMWDYLDSSSDPLEKASRVTNTDTNIVTEEEIQKERERGKPEEIIQQEYFCDRSGANFGSYYGDMLKTYKDQVGTHAYDAGYPVHTMWDLGISDMMAIWFIQFVGRNIYVIDYYENSGYGLGHYAGVLKSKGYMYAMHHLPHDGRKREMTVNERAVTVEAQLKSLEIYPIKVHDRRMDIYGAIQRVRSILSRCFFDQQKTRDGYMSLKQYQREWDEGRQVFKETPLHNNWSHGADAFSILPMIEQQGIVRKQRSAVKYKGSIRR